MFEKDQVGSSSSVCADDYRGPYAFSEPETMAIRDFISNKTNIKLAINLFTYGNNFNQPFNYDDDQNKNLAATNPAAYQFYTDIFKNGNVPPKMSFGNRA